MKIIYEPKGRAGEYAQLAANLFTGCTCGCTYCYVPGMLRMPREKFNSEVTVKHNALARLEADLQRMDKANDRRQVLMSFTSDVFQNDMTTEVTRDAILLFREYGIPFSTLTKCPSNSKDCADLYRECDSFGTTFTYQEMHANTMALKKGTWMEHEVLSNSPCVRYSAFRYLSRDAKLNTWVSLEPIISEEDFTWCFFETLKYADDIRIGAGCSISKPFSYKRIYDFVQDRIQYSKNKPKIIFKAEFLKQLNNQSRED